jgi:hypothetical protein
MNPDDAYEAYREEYKRRFWEKKNAERARRIEFERNTYRIVRSLTFPMPLVAFILLLDFWLPSNIQPEIVEYGWQRTIHSRYGSRLHSYIQTTSFSFEVPHEVHLTYPYSSKDKPVFDIFVTPILNIPLSVEYTLGDIRYTFDVPRGVHTFYSILPLMLMITSVYICYAKEYSKFTWSLVFMPAVLLAIVLLTLL